MPDHMANRRGGGTAKKDTSNEHLEHTAEKNKAEAVKRCHQRRRLTGAHSLANPT